MVYSRPLVGAPLAAPLVGVTPRSVRRDPCKTCRRLPESEAPHDRCMKHRRAIRNLYSRRWAPLAAPLVGVTPRSVRRDPCRTCRRLPESEAAHDRCMKRRRAIWNLYSRRWLNVCPSCQRMLASAGVASRGGPSISDSIHLCLRLAHRVCGRPTSFAALTALVRPMSLVSSWP